MFPTCKRSFPVHSGAAHLAAPPAPAAFVAAVVVDAAVVVVEKEEETFSVGRHCESALVAAGGLGTMFSTCAALLLRLLLTDTEAAAAAALLLVLFENDATEWRRELVAVAPAAPSGACAAFLLRRGKVRFVVVVVVGVVVVVLLLLALVLVVFAGSTTPPRLANAEGTLGFPLPLEARQAASFSSMETDIFFMGFEGCSPPVVVSGRLARGTAQAAKARREKKTTTPKIFGLDEYRKEKTKKALIGGC